MFLVQQNQHTLLSIDLLLNHSESPHEVLTLDHLLHIGQLSDCIARQLGAPSRSCPGEPACDV